MSRRQLASLGLTDEELEAERVKYLGPRQPGATLLDGSAADSHEMMVERRASFSAVMEFWYAPEPPTVEQVQPDET